MADYADMSTEDLQAEFMRLASIYADAANQRAAIDAELKRRSYIASAKVRASALSGNERAALKEQL